MSRDFYARNLVVSASPRFHIYGSICASKLALTRDHEPWPGGESRKRDCLWRAPSPLEGRFPTPPLLHSQLTHFPQRPSRDGLRHSQPFGLSPPAKSRMRHPSSGCWRSSLRSGDISPHTNFHEWNHKAHCFPESAAYLVVDFIDRSTNCIAFIWVNQSFVHKAIVIAKVAQIRVAPKGRIRVPRRRHSCPAQCRRPKVVAQWRCTAKVSIVNSLLEGQKGAQTRPSRRCIDSAHRRRSRATCAGFVVARQRSHPIGFA